MRRALVVGIDKYAHSSPLSGCENDAAAIANTLERNGDGSPNFSVKLLTSDNQDVESACLATAISRLFEGEAETVLFYFAGHGHIDEQTKAGYLVTHDGKSPNWGIKIDDIISQASRAYPRIRSTIIVLDSCQSGIAGNLQVLDGLALLNTGMTILTACRSDGVAAEVAGHGLFTSLFLEGLRGASADVLGRISPASIYSLIDQTLGDWDQRPLYKANVQSFVTLRHMPPKIPLEVLRKLPRYFPDPTSIFPLDPSCEPDRGEFQAKFRAIAVDANRELEYKELQSMNREGLVVPDGQPHMWHAAVHSTGCKLTALGVHYRRLAQDGRI